jgi:hypothetical protein
MTDEKGKKEGPEQETPFTCCNVEDMAKMMQNFGGEGKGTFDCQAMMQMMQKMFDSTPKEPTEK